jgi:pyruvate/2-oxoglutarate dehydrogenase complex dihydrolipoamide acyltransferase (E2) component
MFELKMPKLGESVTEGTIGKWLKKPGDKVNKYDLLVEVQTDKVNTEIPSSVAGTLREIKVQEGETVAIGAALGGLRPVAEMQFADFSAPAFEQIVDEAARIRYRSNGGYGVPMVIRMPWGGGIHGALYHSQSVEAFYAHVPGLKVVVPSTPRDITGMLRAALRDPDPVIFLEHKAT